MAGKGQRRAVFNGADCGGKWFVGWLSLSGIELVVLCRKVFCLCSVLCVLLNQLSDICDAFLAGDGVSERNGSIRTGSHCHEQHQGSVFST